MRYNIEKKTVTNDSGLTIAKLTKGRLLIIPEYQDKKSEIEETIKNKTTPQKEDYTYERYDQTDVSIADYPIKKEIGTEVDLKKIAESTEAKHCKIRMFGKDCEKFKDLVKENCLNETQAQKLLLILMEINK